MPAWCEEDLFQDLSESGGTEVVGADSTVPVVHDGGPTSILGKRMSLQTAREIDRQLSLEDAVAMALLITTQVEMALMLCQQLEKSGGNSVVMKEWARSSGVLEIFWYSADKNQSSVVFEKKTCEVLYLTDNKRILCQSLGLPPEKAIELLHPQRLLPPYRRLLFDFCRQVIPEEQEQLTSLLLARANRTTRYKLMETQLLDLIVSERLNLKQCHQILCDCVQELNYLHLEEFLMPHIQSPIPPPSVEGKEYYDKGPGLAIIINQKNFTSQGGGMPLDARLGTDVDRDHLEIMFTLLGASKIIIYNDLDSVSMKNRLDDCQKYANEKGREYKWFALCILSHGSRTKCGQDQVFAADGVGMDRKKMIRRFACARQSPGLQDIPKIFIVQACRVMEGDTEIASPAPQEEKVERDGDLGADERFPLADYLVISSTVEDFPAYRSTVHGSFFIRILCEELMKFGHTENLPTLINQVNRRMKEIPRYPSMPESYSTLTKEFVFHRTKESMSKAAKLMVLNTIFRDSLVKFVDEKTRHLSTTITSQLNLISLP